MKNNLAATLVASLLLQPLAYGALTLRLDSQNPGDLSSATHNWSFDFDTPPPTMVNTNAGGSTFTSGSGLEGSLAGATGSFAVQVSSNDGFVPTTFARTLSTSVGSKWLWDGGNGSYGTDTPTGENILIQDGEAMVFNFNLSTLSLPAGKALQVDGFWVQNGNEGDPGGQRISFLEGGFGSGNSANQLTGSGTPNALVGGNNVFQPIGQVVETGDEVAIWSEGSGQRRFYGVQFSVVPEPSSLALLGLGLGGLCLRRRRTS